MVKKFGHFLLVIALLGATGGHWAILQTAAWANMLITNLQTESVGAALTKTFDGDHPCRMCQQISAGKKAEKQADLPPPLKKLEFVSATPALILIAPQNFSLVPLLLTHFSDQVEAPLVPPPRA